MGENAAIFKLFNGFSRGKARAEIRLRFSNLLPGPARRPAGPCPWRFHRAPKDVRALCNTRAQPFDLASLWSLYRPPEDRPRRCPAPPDRRRLTGSIGKPGAGKDDTLDVVTSPDAIRDQADIAAFHTLRPHPGEQPRAASRRRIQRALVPPSRRRFQRLLRMRAEGDWAGFEGVDGRDEPGHDDGGMEDACACCAMSKSRPLGASTLGPAA
jgi:hypothetical protein